MHSPKTPPSQVGMSLVELMVGITVALIASLVIINAFSSSEANKRNTLGASDAQQTSAILGTYLSRFLQESGSALIRSEGITGCRLNIKANGTQLFPATDSLAAPFSSVPTNLRAAPVIAIDGTTATTPGSDTLIAMVGRPTASSDDYLAQYQTVLNLAPTPSLGFNAKDYLLVLPVPSEGATSVSDCKIVRVSDSFSQGALSATVNAAYGAQTVGVAATGVALNSNYGTPDSLVDLVVRNLGNSPDVIALARDSKMSLRSLNLLDPTLTSVVVAENIYAIKVLYGVDDAGNDNVVDEWVAPSGTWAASSLLDGSQAGAAKLQQVIALRVGIVIRGSEVASADARTSQVSLFSDLGTAKKLTYSFSGSDARYQYQAYDLTIPLRNPRSLE